MIDVERATMEGLRFALRRAAGVIQGAHFNLAKGISGEAITALAFADQGADEDWAEAVRKAELKLQADWPLSLEKPDPRDGQ